MNKDQFESDYRIPLSNLGITNDSVTEIEIRDQNNIVQLTLLIKDADSLIYCLDGVFFEADKI